MTPPPEPLQPRDRRRAVRIALVAEEGHADLVDGFPGRFQVWTCTTSEELGSLLDSNSVDIVILDCRLSLPDRVLLETVRAERMVDYLAVGRPAGRKSVPSWLRSHWCPWPVDRRSFYRLIVAVARKAAWERAARRSNNQIRKLEKEAELGRKLAQVLHELNNPLDAVLRLVRLAQQDTDGVVNRRLDDALVGLRRMAKTLASLHRDARQIGTALNLVDLREVLREAAVVSAGGGDGIHLRTRIEGGPYRVPEALTPVVTNLLLNARHACRDKGRIEVEARRSARGLEITIRDDGEGFGPLFKDELFKPFFSTRTTGAGMGLGLSTARTAAEQLGGQLDADSAGPGMGATFTLVIPLFERHEEASPSPDVAAEEADGSA